MITPEKIYKRGLDKSNVRLYEVVELLLEIKLDEKNGLSIPTQTDIKSNCCNRLINMYNSLKLEYLKNKSIDKEEFKKKVDILLHEDDEIFNEAVEVVVTLKSNYNEEIESEEL